MAGGVLFTMPALKVGVSGADHLKPKQTQKLIAPKRQGALIRCNHMVTITESRGGATAALVLPDGSPTYSDLIKERDRLVRMNASLVDQIAQLKAGQTNEKELWECIEDVACGRTIDQIPEKK